MDTALGFHVETRRCANPECRRNIDAERSFCSGCWSRLRVGTRRRIVASHAHRAGRLHTVRMAISELKSKATTTKAPKATTTAPKATTNGGLR